MFDSLVHMIHAASKKEFQSGVAEVRSFIDRMELPDFKIVVKNIGIIPEHIEHDSSEEKLYSKASDLVLARSFRELGLAAKALDERADSADILAESIRGYHYSLVADAKCFRLSRTAKNQKDFKIANLSDWRGAENEYAVLVAPYFQYPQIKSQIYSKALEHNVCLLAWEHISLLLEHDVKETDTFTLESLWNASQMMARDKNLSFANAQSCFLPKMDEFVVKKIGIGKERYEEEFLEYKKFIFCRSRIEVSYWKEQIEEIRAYTRQKAIEELILAKKLYEKIKAIQAYAGRFEIQE